MQYEKLEIELSDVVVKLLDDLRVAQRDSALRYAMCEQLKRRIAELEKTAAPADS